MRRQAIMARKPATLLDHFSDLEDQRVERTKLFPLSEIIAIALCAVIGGAESWVQVVLFGRSKIDWFRRFLVLEHGIPSHDTFARVFALLDPRQIQEGFQEWIAGLCAGVPLKQVAIDGKTLRGSGKGKGGARQALHLVHAWAVEQHLLLGAVATDAKSNEITAIPKLLELLDLHGAFVTIDAMGCQKEIAEQIRAQGGDYVLAVKENQPHLHEDIQRYWLAALGQEFAGVNHSYAQAQETGHGRREARMCWVFPDVAAVRDRELWRDLRSIVVVVTEREVGGKSVSETRYYICSRKAGAKTMLSVTRGHWGVENSLHWVLDVTFAEDAGRIADLREAENLALLRRLALSALKRANGGKDSIRAKRMRAGWDNDFLTEVILETADG
jgi:predicted transposase YbfD/YdcC